MGFLNFYRKFLKDLSRTAQPLYELTKKEVPFKWTNECQEAFNKLKNQLVEAPVLAMAHDDGTMKVEADTSLYATGGVLTQEQEQGGIRPIAFYSKSLSDVKRNYPTHNHKLLAIMRVLKEWWHYIIRCPIEIHMDHHNLQCFMTKWNLNCWQARWAMELSVWLRTQVQKRVNNDPSRHLVKMTRP